MARRPGSVFFPMRWTAENNNRHASLSERLTELLSVPIPGDRSSGATGWEQRCQPSPTVRASGKSCWPTGRFLMTTGGSVKLIVVQRFLQTFPGFAFAPAKRIGIVVGLGPNGRRGKDAPSIIAQRINGFSFHAL